MKSRIQIAVALFVAIALGGANGLSGNTLLFGKRPGTRANVTAQPSIIGPTCPPSSPGCVK